MSNYSTMVRIDCVKVHRSVQNKPYSRRTEKIILCVSDAVMACWTDVRAIRVRSSANAYHIIHYTWNILLVQFMSDESPSQLIFHIVDNNKFFMYKYNLF